LSVSLVPVPNCLGSDSATIPQGGGLSTGAIVGISIGAIVFATVIIVVLGIVVRRKRKKHDAEANARIKSTNISDLEIAKSAQRATVEHSAI
jgi:orotate phosphoribosyltransferase